LKTDICSAQEEIWAIKEVTASLPDLAGNWAAPDLFECWHQRTR